MTPYQPAAWHDLFVAVAGAAAALTGLIFVAVSINLTQILKYRALPARAAETDRRDGQRVDPADRDPALNRLRPPVSMIT